jgi:hypothetical protein
MRGVYPLRHGRRGVRVRAVRALRHGLLLAEHLAVAYDQPVVDAALATAMGGDHGETACELFTRLGCRWHLQRAE